MKKQIKTLNNSIKKCKKCRLNITRKNAICGEGKLDAKFMLIAQAPGIEEDKIGKMFVGPSGKVLDKLLNINQLKREDLYMTNLIKCLLPDYRKPKQDEIDICSHYLNKEIELINPSVIVTLGYFATRYIFYKYNLVLPSSKKDFYNLYGKLLLSSSYKILPLQHPVSVIYNPSIKEIVEENYHKLSILLNECKWYQVCPMKKYYEQNKIKKKWIDLYCRGDWESCIRYNLEESGEIHPDWMLPDGTINEKLKKYEDLC